MRQLTAVEKQWLFEKSALDHTPSRQADISLVDELMRRKEAIEYMRSLALRAGLGSENHEHTSARGVLTVAATLVHRFYMRRSLEDFKERLIAPTILFLASKVEEEPLKLRHIVNACLAKWDPNAQQWHVDPNTKENYPPQSREYQVWEREILAMEEMALEALCFDMGVEQPWTILKRSVTGLNGWTGNTLIRDAAESSGDAALREEMYGSMEGKGKGKSRLTEAVVREFGWTLLNQTSMTPLSILHHAYIIAMSTFVLIVALVDEVPLNQALAAAAELGDKFRVQVAFDPETGMVGVDAPEVKTCCQAFIEYCRIGLIDGSLEEMIKPEPTEFVRYVRKFDSDTETNGHGPSMVSGDESMGNNEHGGVTMDGGGHVGVDGSVIAVG